MVRIYYNFSKIASSFKVHRNFRRFHIEGPGAEAGNGSSRGRTKILTPGAYAQYLYSPGRPAHLLREAPFSYAI